MRTVDTCATYLADATVQDHQSEEVCEEDLAAVSRIALVGCLMTSCGDFRSGICFALLVPTEANFFAVF